MTITIQQAIDAIISAVPGAAVPGTPPQDTVDTVKIGDPAQPLTGIVTTFLATVEVIEQASQLGANLIITHEPIFYNHRDESGLAGGQTGLRGQTPSHRAAAASSSGASTTSCTPCGRIRPSPACSMSWNGSPARCRSNCTSAAFRR